MVLAAAAALSGTTPPSVNAAPSASPSAQCPAGNVPTDAVTVDWHQRVDSALAQHEELRRAWNAGIPEGASRVLMYYKGGDLATTRVSLIAVRKADGIWHTNEIGDSVIWVAGAKPQPIPTTDRDLSAADSKRVDQLLDDPCLNAGPAFLGRPAVGVGPTTLEVETPARHWRAAWAGTFSPQEEEIVKLLGPKD